MRALQTTQMMARMGKVALRLPMLSFMAPRITGARAPTAKPVMIMADEQLACRCSGVTSYSTA